MKKFESILNEIKGLHAEVKKAQDQQSEEIERYFRKFDGLTLKEKVQKEKAEAEEKEMHLEKVAEFGKTITDGKLKIKLLENNAKISLYHEVMPTALEVYEKYKGKPYGEKTKEKIRAEIKEKTNCNVYMDESTFSIYPLHNSYYDVKCGTRYVDGKQKLLLIDNKIQCVDMDDLQLYHINRTYFDDLDSTILEMKKLHAEAQKKQEELIKICSEFNKLSVNGISDLSHTTYKISSII